MIFWGSKSFHTSSQPTSQRCQRGKCREVQGESKEKGIRGKGEPTNQMRTYNLKVVSRVCPQVVTQPRLARSKKTTLTYWRCKTLISNYKIQTNELTKNKSLKCHSRNQTSWIGAIGGMTARICWKTSNSSTRATKMCQTTASKTPHLTETSSSRPSTTSLRIHSRYCRGKSRTSKGK